MNGFLVAFKVLTVDLFIADAQAKRSPPVTNATLNQVNHIWLYICLLFEVSFHVLNTHGCLYFFRLEGHRG
jgi:hypothetical protein